MHSMQPKKRREKHKNKPKLSQTDTSHKEMHTQKPAKTVHAVSEQRHAVPLNTLWVISGITYTGQMTQLTMSKP